MESFGISQYDNILPTADHISRDISCHHARRAVTEGEKDLAEEEMAANVKCQRKVQRTNTRQFPLCS
jgi:hypothetical protein